MNFNRTKGRLTSGSNTFPVVFWAMPTISKETSDLDNVSQSSGDWDFIPPTNVSTTVIWRRTKDRKSFVNLIKKLLKPKKTIWWSRTSLQTWLSVKVPVLSLHIVVADPMVSQAESLLTCDKTIIRVRLCCCNIDMI